MTGQVHLARDPTQQYRIEMTLSLLSRSIPRHDRSSLRFRTPQGVLHQPDLKMSGGSLLDPLTRADDGPCPQSPRGPFPNEGNSYARPFAYQ
jgi:hypothetical protein